VTFPVILSLTLIYL